MRILKSCKYILYTYLSLLAMIYIFGDSESSFWFEDELVGIRFL